MDIVAPVLLYMVNFSEKDIAFQKTLYDVYMHSLEDE